ncbi:hypothetical protein BJ875DRAFT_487262 [Amylocarpus encephaloides]|uniref:Uncharacterized protein n=1 Tax=Amylocarpus encephaloides TaxID=45428 RepID=A0A9P7YCG7_9HELO|nr:hypothetical protein BJ875DRAFT_487262 [Amylocarpus encephaloides]
MSEVIYIGIWTDYDRGAVLGKVLTLPTRTATILVTTLAILVTIMANRSWKIWRFLLHHLLHHSQGRTIEHSTVKQQQVVLRNSETAGGAIVSLIELTLKCRRDGRPLSAVASRLPLILFGLVHWMTFIALGILTSQINVGRIVRSAETTGCGLWLPSDSLSGLENTLTSNGLIVNATLAADNYVRNCYNNESSRISECNKFVERVIPQFSEMVQCPFRDKEICSLPDKEAIAFTSGNISFSDLGLNSRFARMLSVRRRTVCSPIALEPFLYDDEANQAALKSLGHDRMDEPELHAYAYTLDHQGQNLTGIYRRHEAGDYDLTTRMALNETFALEPLKPQEPSMEVSIITLRGRTILFVEPSSDPLFYAQDRRNGTDFEYYLMGRPLNSIACQEMAEICSSITGNCSNWQGLSALWTRNNRIALLGSHINDTEATAIYDAVEHAISYSGIFYAVGGRGNSALQATRNTYQGVQHQISENQWKIELEQWFKTTLAGLQIAPYRMVVMPDLDRNRVYNLRNGSDPICSMVKFRSPEHASLSLLGIMIILVFSVVITALSYCDSVLNMAHTTRMLGVLTPWKQDDYLHLLDKAEGINENLHAADAFDETKSNDTPISYRTSVLCAPVSQPEVIRRKPLPV